MRSTFLQIVLIISSPEGFRLQFFHSTCIFCIYGMALYWPTLQFYVCVYVSFVCQYVAPPGECYYNTLLCCKCFSSSSVLSCALAVLWMCLKFGHHPHPLGYLCAKFCFFRGRHCWASPWRKIAYSINQSLTQLIWCPEYRSLCFGISFFTGFLPLTTGRK